jgi:F420-dependent oxidoreductase-like protein
MAKYPIRFGIYTSLRPLEWEPIRNLWQKADQWGYDSLWHCDHFYQAFPPDPDGPCLEGWTTISALSQLTRRARVGVLVSGVAYRNPCVLAKMAATLDIVSGGRINLGIGAGWYELEYRNFGFDFQTPGARLQQLDEACQIIKSMFTQDRTTLHGRHYQVTDAACIPKPVQKPNPPLLVAGMGEKVLLKTVARHADMWNGGGSAEQMKRAVEIITRHCDALGRDADAIEKTVVMPLCYGASAETEAAVASGMSSMSQVSPEEACKQIMIGTRGQCLDTIERYLDAGITHFIFLVTPFNVDEEFERFAQEVIPQFKGAH